MPRQQKRPDPELTSPDYDVLQSTLAAIKATWAQQQKNSKIDAVRFSQLSVLALTQFAAIVGVDVGMTQTQFSNVCNAQFAEAYRRAPKFG